MVSSLGSALQAPVRGKIVFDRESRQLSGRQRATTALAHFLVIIEDIDHRANRLVTTAEEGICGTVRVDQPKDVVAITALIAAGGIGTGAEEKCFGGLVVGPQHLARQGASNGGGPIGALTQRARDRRR